MLVYKIEYVLFTNMSYYDMFVNKTVGCEKEKI